MVERKVAWKDRKDNVYIGKRISRIDGVQKATGKAKYSSDINTKGTLIGRVLTCTYAYAKITKLDITKARAMKGVHAVHIFRKEGDTIRWDGTPVVAVAAENTDIAKAALKAVVVEYDKLDHFVDETDLKAAEKANRTRSLGNNQKGNVKAALKEAKVVHKGYYGVQTISHMCMESHGSHCEWHEGGKLHSHLSTQNVSGTGSQFAGAVDIDAADVEVTCNYIGGGFGSKFGVDEWDKACAKMAKAAGRPVRLMLDRATELKIAGTRPSGFAEVTIAADAAGNIIAWDSHHWGSSGTPGGTVSLGQYPYVFNFANRNRKATGIKTNTGPNRAWRAPPHPQLCALTCPAIDDVAAKLGMDSYDVFKKNLNRTGKPDVYEEEMKIAADMIGWKKKWHLHGKNAGNGALKRGLGMALHQWGGRAHSAKCTVKVHPDGTVESFGGTQDLGTGTRTIIAITLADTFGIPLENVKVHIGSNKYPQSGPSGGSTTVGGVSGPNRRAGLEALWKIFDKVAVKYNVEGDSLIAKLSAIWSKGKKVCSWKDACSLLGPMPLEVEGTGAKNDGLTSSGVGGVQMADVSVDIETGKVKINEFAIVQDCGMIIDLKTAESQVYGGVIMGISYSLSEERIMDNATGRYINADMKNYKLPRIGDIGDLKIHMYQPDSEYNRGVIGLGEPPVISTGAAISNAVANAIGVRVPVLPLTPQRVLDALKGASS